MSSRRLALALLLLSAVVLLAVECRPQAADPPHPDYSADYDDEEPATPLRTLPPTTTTTSRRPHFVKYRVPGEGDCWRRHFGGAFRYVKSACYFCPKGSVINGSGNCWSKGIGFRLLN